MSTFSTCTSSTRPSSPDDGDVLFETDTKNVIIWDGTAWRGYQNDSQTLAPITNTTSITFDGVDDFVLIPSNSSYAFGTGDFSIICWFNADAIPGPYHALYDFRTSGSSIHPSFFLGTPSGNRYYFYTGNTSINFDTTPATGTWFMNAVVRNSGTTTVYQNATSVASGSNTENYGTPTNGIRVGIANDGTLDYDGYLDEFAIFDSALSSSQISEIYNGSNPVDLSPLSPLTWLRMGDGDTGTTVTDHGSLGNDASLQNNASFSTNTAP